ncbi:hypothetical protein FPOAC2_07673 [Fusarium poae]|uniref:NACHT domain-containing protein n=1 Tax=Fusarium poae TaxID=36050 RepID=A0A1B8AIT0_FUSPO|nr:hypothetical protein FPOAC1_007768 [Fusarium poae]KAG8668389.1 hypothetical protein FPOAC1_007768 [Fusarium poae]OBS20475.1 hypothetical protein FPOA_06843 [Fusarium poae]
MEVGGFAMGAIALVSLAKDCTELYAMFVSAQELEKDSSSLVTKLDIERNRFFTWSGRVELLHQDENGLVFGNKSTDDLVKRILQIIKDLLTDATRLENMYGVQRVGPAKQSELSVTPKPILESASELQLPQFVRDFRKIKRTFSSYRSSKIDSFSKHFTWVIIDKEKFNKLIYDLSYYNTRLDELVPGSTPFSTAKGHNGTNLSVTVEVSEDNLNRREAAMAARSDAIRARVLNTLWFRWLDDRRLTVKDAHAQTFSWVLDPDVDTESPNHLPTWLQSGSGIYWLYGKAGSGKSTLMKFLHDDERTQKYLKTWAGDSELISISFFFYALGHPEQKSQLGLLRSLLYQILSHDAALAETALPNVWREASRDNEQKHEDLSMPSVAEMVNALKCICKMYRATKKMFFLIDGIDEYEGNDIDIAGFISELGKFSDVKVLVSSRPHPAFFTSFRESPSMDLPRLTEQDIASYVDDTVASHPYMKDLYAMDPNAAHSITRSLVERASGVFLWVVLVCRSVIEGCDEYETTSDLQARVDESPKEIEDLFNHIFESIPPRWGDEATKIMFLMYKNAFGGVQTYIPPISQLVGQLHQKKWNQNASQWKEDYEADVVVSSKLDVLRSQPMDLIGLVKETSMTRLFAIAMWITCTEPSLNFSGQSFNVSIRLLYNKISILVWCCAIFGVNSPPHAMNIDPVKNPVTDISPIYARIASITLLVYFD